MKPGSEPDLYVSGRRPACGCWWRADCAEAITAGLFKPGHRLVERRLCELTGVGRTSIREALRQLEAEGLVTTLPHRGPVVSTMTIAEAEQLYAVRALLEGFAGRECARRRDSGIVARLSEELDRMHAHAAEPDRRRLLADKTEFYAALLDGCGNVFVQRFLNMLLNRVTLLRLTSMSQPGRIKHTLIEMSAIVKAVEAGDEVAAERACVVHVQNASAAALDVLSRNSSKSDDSSAFQARREPARPTGDTKGERD